MSRTIRWVVASACRSYDVLSWRGFRGCRVHILTNFIVSRLEQPYGYFSLIATSSVRVGAAVCPLKLAASIGRDGYPDRYTVVRRILIFALVEYCGVSAAPAYSVRLMLLGPTHPLSLIQNIVYLMAGSLGFVHLMFVILGRCVLCAFSSGAPAIRSRHYTPFSRGFSVVMFIQKARSA